MSKKISIAKAVDVDRLRENISLYRHETGVVSPYIFANDETIYEIGKNCNCLKKCCLSYSINKYVGYFEGYKLFLDNTLSFGEVEIR